MVEDSGTTRPSSTSSGIDAGGHSAAISERSPSISDRERNVTFVQSDQHLPAVQREWVLVEDERHAGTSLARHASSRIHQQARAVLAICRILELVKERAVLGEDEVSAAVVELVELDRGQRNREQLAVDHHVVGVHDPLCIDDVVDATAEEVVNAPTVAPRGRARYRPRGSRWLARSPSSCRVSSNQRCI